MKITKEQIEKEVSKFSEINYKLNDFSILKEGKQIFVVNINIKNNREVYAFDAKTFELLEQIE